MKKFLILLLALIHFSGFSQNKLDRSKSQVNSGKQATATASTTSSYSPNSDNTVLEPLVEILFFVPVAIAKYGLLGDYKNEDHLHNELTPYPLHTKGFGNYQFFDAAVIGPKKWRFDIENHFIYSNNALFGNHLEAKIRCAQYFQLQADYYQLWELNRFDNSANRLSLFYFNLGYDRIRLEKFNLGWTLGASYMGNEVKKAGFSYGLKADYFLTTNLSVGAMAKWSFINTAPVHSYQLQSRFHKKNYFASVAFEHLKIATPVYNFIGIGGGIYL